MVLSFGNMDMNLPLFPAPNGYVVDLANPQRVGQAANFYVGAIGMILAILFLGIRIYTKVVLARNFSADDGMFNPIEHEVRDLIYV